MNTTEAAVRDVLNQSRIEGTILYLPNVQLDRKTYTAVNDILERIGGKWNRKQKGHIFTGDPSEALQSILGGAQLPKKMTGLEKNPDAFWPTPYEVCLKMVEVAQLDKALTVLEPSAGEGAIADAVRRAGVPGENIHCCDINEERLQVVCEKGYHILHLGDFLQLQPGRLYDRVLMNPPFAIKGNPTVYIDHIRHAHTFLAEDGVLVAIAPSGILYRSDKKTAAFREFCEEHGTISLLPDGAFKESKTMTSTVMIKLHRRG